MASKTLKLLCCALLSAALSACGGSGGSGSGSDVIAAAPAAPTAPACTPKIVNVLLIGDSTMYGYDSFTRTQAITPPQQLLQAEMDTRFGTGAVLVKLNAVIGSSSSALLNGTDGYTAWPQGVAADIVVLNYGINDQDTTVGEPIDQYEANLRAIVSKYPSAKYVFETPNDTPGVNQRLADYAQRMRDVAKSLNIPVADTYAYVKSLPHFESYFADFAHPSNDLYRMIITNSLAPAVAPVVSPMRCK